MFTSILFLLLLIAVIIMAVRDGRPFFADFLKVTIFVLILLIALLAWGPIVSLRFGR